MSTAKKKDKTTFLGILKAFFVGTPSKPRSWDNFVVWARLQILVDRAEKDLARSDKAEEELDRWLNK